MKWSRFGWVWGPKHALHDMVIWHGLTQCDVSLGTQHRHGTVTTVSWMNLPPTDPDFLPTWTVLVFILLHLTSSFTNIITATRETLSRETLDTRATRGCVKQQSFETLVKKKKVKISTSHFSGKDRLRSLANWLILCYEGDFTMCVKLKQAAESIGILVVSAGNR